MKQAMNNITCLTKEERLNISSYKWTKIAFTKRTKLLGVGASKLPDNTRKVKYLGVT